MINLPLLDASAVTLMMLISMFGWMLHVERRARRRTSELFALAEQTHAIVSSIAFFFDEARFAHGFAEINVAAGVAREELVETRIEGRAARPSTVLSASRQVVADLAQ